MRIYIDEAGLFAVHPGGPHSYSLVLALIIPSTHENQVFHEFEACVATKGDFTPAAPKSQRAD
jgi:hypothetical protein